MSKCKIENQTDEKFCASCGLRWGAREEKPPCLPPPQEPKDLEKQPAIPDGRPALKLQSFGDCSDVRCILRAKYNVDGEGLCPAHAKEKLWQMGLSARLTLKR